MKGIVKYFNPLNGFFAVEMLPGEFSVIETSNLSYFKQGDVVEGNLNSLGSESITNQSNGNTISVFIQDCSCSLSRVQQLFHS